MPLMYQANGNKHALKLIVGFSFQSHQKGKLWIAKPWREYIELRGGQGKDKNRI